MKTDFQAGVDTLYGKCVAKGATPTAKTPSAIASAIDKIYTDRYNSGLTNGRSAVTKTLALTVAGGAGNNKYQEISLTSYSNYQKITENNIIPVVYKTRGSGGYDIDPTMSCPTVSSYTPSTGKLIICYTVASNNMSFKEVTVGVYIVA